MKKFALASALFSSITISNSYAAVLIDTGSPEFTQNGAIAVCATNICNQSVALQFSLANSYTISDIQGYFWGGNGGGSLTLALYSDGNGVPGEELYSGSFTVPNLASSNGRAWVGVNNVSWLVSAGAYWASFEVRNGQTYSGGLDFPAPIKLPAAVNNPMWGQWTNVGGAAGGGLIVSGELVSSVPVPAAAWLFGSGLIGLVATGRKRKAH